MADGQGGNGMGAVVEDVGRRGRRRLAPGQAAAMAQTRIPQAQGENVNAYPYYSIVRYQLTITAGPTPGSFLYNLAKGETRRAFGYAIGDQMGVAGFPGTQVANDLDTNLVNKSQTNSGQTVRARGISVYVPSDSDPVLLKLLSERLSITLAMNGEENKFRLGRLGFLPGGGGLNGGGNSVLTKPGVYDQQTLIAFGANGLPGRENFYPLPFPVIWKRAGQADSTLVLITELQKAISFRLDSRLAGGVDSGIEAWSPPSVEGEFGTYVDLVFRLHTVQVAKRSVNL